jgi:hypothetical protein
MLSVHHSLNLNLCSKQYNNFLHLIVVPQLSGGWQRNYSTKTRQAGHANEQSMYSLMSMLLIYSLDICGLTKGAWTSKSMLPGSRIFAKKSFWKLANSCNKNDPSKS